jgi:3-oxoacyl-[acyl-carrier protein] reductase
MRSPRTVLVTGSSRGIGRAIAGQLLERGDTVIGCARGDCDLQHRGYRHFRVDIADDTAVRGMFSAITSEHGRLDLLINNAGVGLSRMALLTSSAEFASILQVNLLGTFIVAREAMRLMKRARFGRIINFSSINVPLASVGGAAYNATKAGLENLTVTLARECADDDITVNCIGLSLVAGTGMVDALDPKAIQAKQQALIKPSLIDVSDVLHAVEFFAAAEARNITAQTVYFGGVQ